MEPTNPENPILKEPATKSAELIAQRLGMDRNKFNKEVDRIAKIKFDPDNGQPITTMAERAAALDTSLAKRYIKEAEALGIQVPKFNTETGRKLTVAESCQIATAEVRERVKELLLEVEAIIDPETRRPWDSGSLPILRMGLNLQAQKATGQTS